MKKIMQNAAKLLLVFFTFFMSSTLLAQPAVDYLPARPLSDAVTTSLQPVNGFTKLPYITWGGDLQIMLAQQEGLFASNGLNFSLYKEDDFKKQVEACLRGEIPGIRGTLAMINSATELFKQEGTELVVIIGLTTSEGGDCMVARSGKNLSNISTVALQLYGPHMDYAANLFSQKGRLGAVKFKWLQNLTVSDKVGGRAVDPVTAFQKDNTLDAVMCISPDAALLTSGGTIGSGTDNSVKGAKIILSTKTASKVIYDVYAFRKDFYDANRQIVEKFVKSMFVAEEHLAALRASKGPKFTALVAEGVKNFGLPKGDVEAMLGDCRFLGYNGNVSFFTGKGTTRNFVTLNKEIQTSFKAMGLMKGPATILQANWDYSSLASGLKNASAVPQTVSKFNTKALQATVEKNIVAEGTDWEEKGTLFSVEIYFQPNQNEFAAQDYAKDFEKALKISQTYSGAVVVVEGHSDHGAISKAKQTGKSLAEVKQMTQVAKNLSLERAQNVRKSFLSYAKGEGITMDASQFVAVGQGIANPKYKKPTTREEWQENFRVIFLIKQMEAESGVFDPSAY